MMSAHHRETTYQQWIRQEGLPVVEGYGLTDVRALELAPWVRAGGRGAFIQLVGMEGLTGMYVAEIPPGGALKPEKHLYEELVYVLSGRGLAEVWQEGQPPATVEWRTGSLFAPPLNTWHRLVNSGPQPARLLAVTTAPLVLDLFHNPDFVFGCDHRFGDRYDGSSDYFGQDRRLIEGRTLMWETNLIADARVALLDPRKSNGAHEHLSTSYQMAGNVLTGHLADWPPAQYDKAHYHGGGAVLLMLRSRGYSLMWPREVGIRPYQSGQADRVVRVDWQEGSVLSPPTGWFHAHFNTGAEPSRELALRYASHRYGLQFHDSQAGTGRDVSVKEGGATIEYEDEDPELRRIYERELAGVGAA